jgi:glycine/D-amino acid oxidase-like deaminating enzyme
MPASLYAVTARAAPPEAPLTRDVKTQVAIVGGGFTGLSAALHLAAAGVDAAVLEANEVGWGASGRNGGQVNAGLKWEPDEIKSVFGADLGERMIKLGGSAPDLVFELIARHGIACEPARGGTIRAAVSPRSEADIREFHRQWQARGAPVELLDRAGMAAATGTSAYPLGCLDRRGGNINPLGYARGLAEAALKAGARIFSGARATKLAQNGKTWEVHTPLATVTAERVILATNGYTDDLWPGLRRTVLPVYSAIIATALLEPGLAMSIMPARPVLYEMSAAYAYYRVDAQNRFLMGGRSVLRDSSNFRDYARLVDHAVRLFPQLRQVEWTHWWNGKIAITWDHLPHIHEPAPGLHIGLGYNGRGIAMATATGRMMAKRAGGGPAEELDLPVTRMSPITGHAVWPFAVTARLKWDQLRERVGL